MNFLINQIREKKLLEAEMSIDNFIKDNSISNNSVIHTMFLSKEVFKEEIEAREYLKDKYMYDPELSETETDFIAVLVSPMQVDLETEVDLELRRGVRVKAADIMPLTTSEELVFNDKGEVKLTLDYDTINLTEGLPHIIEIARVAEGDHPTYGKLKITKEHLKSMENNFKAKVVGVDLAVNEDHQKNEAFGWFKEVFLSFEGDILYGQVLWNTKGIQALSEKEYRYFSPEFRFNYVHPHTGKEHGPTLLGGALTNYPFLKMEAITELNSKIEKGEKIMSDNTTIDLAVHNEKIVELNDKIKEVNSALEISESKNVELSSKIDELKAEIEKGKKEAAHKKLFDDNKISKAQLVALNEGKSFLEVLALNESMNTEAKGSSEVEEEEIQLSETEKKMCEQLNLTPEEYRAANK